MVLVVDPRVAGISGDMLLSSLVDLGADGDAIISGIRESERFLPGSSIRRIGFEGVQRNGVRAVRLALEVSEEPGERSGSEMRAAVSGAAGSLGMSQQGRSFAGSCIDTLIRSESAVHGVPEESVHFHEASSIDTLVDVLGVALAMEDLGLFGERIVCTPVSVGSGSVTFSHGTMSNPAAAVLEVFKGSGIRIRGNAAGGELATPTGSCMLVNMTGTCVDSYPEMSVDSVGYGAGGRDYGGFANVLKLVRGTEGAPGPGRVTVLETNVDDVPGEVLGGLVERLVAGGAKDASICQGIGKKGRPTSLVSVVCGSQEAAGLIDILVMETGTLGVRISESDRFTVPRTSHTARVSIPGGTFEVSYKRSSFRGRDGFKIEFDDLRRVSGAISRPLRETEHMLRQEIEGIERGRKA